MNVFIAASGVKDPNTVQYLMQVRVRCAEVGVVFEYAA
jgi:hypothetical protein